MLKSDIFSFALNFGDKIVVPKKHACELSLECRNTGTGVNIQIFIKLVERIIVLVAHSDGRMMKVVFNSEYGVRWLCYEIKMDESGCKKSQMHANVK